MELPKNITQIGEVNPFCKIYVEDYVISYLKQMNQVALNKNMAVALYGERKTDGEITYLFMYGACKLDFLQRETRHLSQAQKLEIEKLRKKYFVNYDFLGYRFMNGEMIEGFHVCEKDVCRYIEGYAQFYTKNETMLAYMLGSREQESCPEVVDSTKYEMVKKRQEARKWQESQKATGTQELGIQAEQMINTEPVDNKEATRSTGNMRGMKLATVAVFVLLCMAGLSNLGGVESVEDLRNAAEDMVADMTEQKLPDAVEVKEANSTVVVQDKLSEALQEENRVVDTSKETEAVPEPVRETAPEPAIVSEPVAEATPEPVVATELKVETASAPAVVTEPVAEATPEPVVATEPVVETVSEPMSYTIGEGDTLLGICFRAYGSNVRMEEVCELNEIDDPDDIKVGQKILLPQ